MAKTIKEMALKNYPDHPTNEELTRSRRLRRIGFEFGANSVIAEIESIAFSDIGSYKSILDKIQNKLKELKGEQL